MSNARGPPVGVIQTKRRTWDEEEYKKKAEERAAREAGTAQVAPEYLPASERAALTERKNFYDFDSRVGKITAVNDKDRSSGGFYCELCDVLLRDSLSFTNHLNGRKHLRKQGVSEYTKKSTLEDVLAVLEFGRRKRFPERYITERLAAAMATSKAMESAAEKSTRSATSSVQRIDAVAAKASNEVDASGSAANGMEVDAEDAEMQEMLGFTGFGSSKGKKR